MSASVSTEKRVRRQFSRWDTRETLYEYLGTRERIILFDRSHLSRFEPVGWGPKKRYELAYSGGIVELIEIPTGSATLSFDDAYALLERRNLDPANLEDTLLYASNFDYRTREYVYALGAKLPRLTHRNNPEGFDVLMVGSIPHIQRVKVDVSIDGQIFSYSTLLAKPRA